MEFAKEFIGQYGYFAIYGLLALGVIGMPIPDEVMMTFVGYLASISVLNYSVSIAVSFGGAFTGGLLSYMIGKKRAGRWLKNTASGSALMPNDSAGWSRGSSNMGIGPSSWVTSFQAFVI